MSKHSQFQLFKKRFFASYFTTQALGAFNDNLFKNAIIMLITFQAVTAESNTNLLNNLAAGLLIVPFVLFSSLAGQFAEKYEKSMLIRRIKLVEIAIMLFGALGFYLGSVPMLLTVLFFMGSQSTFFGPIKYSILPQHLKSEQILGGTGLVEMGTFVAIIIGMVAGGLLMSYPEQGRLFVSIGIVLTAIVGFLASRRIPHTPAVTPELKIDWNLWRESRDIFRFIKKDRTLFLIVLGNAWFWFVGAVVLPQIPNFTKVLLGGDAKAATLITATFSIGVAIGSVLCDVLSGKRIEVGLVPLGALGMTLCLGDMYFATPNDLPTGELLTWMQFLGTAHGLRVTFDCLMLGVFGGFYIVPLYALLQTRSEQHHLSRVIAGNNILGSLFMIGSAVFSIVMLSVVKLSIAQFFLLMAVLNLLICVVIFRQIPEFFMRFVVWILTHLVYRVNKSGVDNIPSEGGCVVVCNHVSYVDSLLLSGALPRPMRFVIWYKFYEMPVLTYLFKAAKTIPIANIDEDPALLKAAMDKIDQALKNGEVICIFPEGKLTYDGEINEFKSGIEHIIERNAVPVIPVALQGLWHSLFSRNPKRLANRFKRFRTRVGVVVGEPIPPSEVTKTTLFARIQALRGDNA